MTAQVGAFVVVERGANIGPRCRIYPQCYIGEDCEIGADVTLFPQVVLYQDVTIGAGSILHSGTVLGVDGFGFVWDGQQRIKIPQVGGIKIGKNVEIGGNTVIDRATCGNTELSDGVKFDNLIHIAHNVKIGEDSAIAAQVGIAGSSTIGKRAVMGGQAAVGDHITIVDDVTMGGRTGAMINIEQPGEYFGLPPVPRRQAMRGLALQIRLPELFARLKKLEAEVERLKDDS